MSKNRLDFKANLSRHSHDVSAGYTSTMSCGMIIPQYFDILGPGDSIYYRTHMFARMQDVVTAFLGEVDLHIDYFFVPLQMIYTPFGQIFAQTDDFVTSLYSSMAAKDTFPTIGIDHSFGVNTAYSANGVSEFECEGKKIMRMLDAFDMNPYEVVHADFFPTGYTRPSTSPVTNDICYNPPIAPWIPCAYQAIYQKYYRNDEFEKLDVDSYNVDTLYNASGVTLNKKYFDLNWCQRPSDYFTKTRISPIASAVNRFGSSGQFPSNGGSLGTTDILDKVDSFLTSKQFGIDNAAFGQNLMATPASNAFDNVSAKYKDYGAINTGTYFSLALSAANIRALFAVDKFSRIYGRADKTYDDQILAHFGIEIPHDVKHDLTHLKHYHMVIQSDPIYGTANTALADDSKFIGTIGQVGGQGQAVIDTDQEKFTAPVHGVFMAVAYVVTKPRYTNTFSKLHLCTNRLSFPIPEYDKLGAQPLYAFEFSRVFLQPDYNNQSFRPVRRGWQNRYQQFKEKYNRASIVFEKPKDIWNPSNSVDNIYSSWVVNRAPFEVEAPSTTSQFLDPIKFFENPHNLDSIMVRPYVSSWSNDYFATPHLIFQTDPLITEFMCFAKKVSWMSETGEPDL